MEKDIKSMILGCAICKVTKSPLRTKVGTLGQFSLQDESFEFLHIDHVGPLPETEDGFKYTLTAIDRATNYVFAIPVKDCTAETTVQAIADRILAYVGVPRVICSDRGPAFANSTSELLSKFYGFKWQFVTAYNPRANGKVERIHRPLKAALKTFAMKNQRDWVKALPSFVFGMNNFPSKALGRQRSISPHVLVFGKEPTMPVELVWPKDTWTDAAELFAMKVRAMAEAATAVRLAREAARKLEDQKNETEERLEPRLQAGDTVLLYVPAVPERVSVKVYPQWQGPFQIMEQMGPYNYKIKGKGRVQIVHARRLMKFDPYLLEHESVAEALERTKEDFGRPPPLPKKGQEEQDEAKDCEIPQVEEKVDLRRREAEERIQAHPLRKLGTSLKEIEWKQGLFYLLRPDKDEIRDVDTEEWFLMEVTTASQKDRRTRAVSKKTPTFRFWRSFDQPEKQEERLYLPVSKDSKGLETWDGTIKPDDNDYRPWLIQTRPT